jgi:hypothetical protein
VHLEAVLENAPDSEPDERVIIDHKAVWALTQDCFRSLVCGWARLPKTTPSVPILAQPGSVR